VHRLVQLLVLVQVLQLSDGMQSAEQPVTQRKHLFLQHRQLFYVNVQFQELGERQHLPVPFLDFRADQPITSMLSHVTAQVLFPQPAESL
jgi:hypothetical protein